MKRLRITICRIGGGYLRAVYGQTRDSVTGGWNPEAVIGKDEDEILTRLKARIPALNSRAGRNDYELKHAD